MNEILRVRSYRSSFTNEFVHASFMFDSFMNDFCRFHFYRSFSDERTKRPAFFRSCSMFVHLWTNDRSFVLAVQISHTMRNGRVFRYTLQMNLSPFEVSEEITIHIISPYNSESSSRLTSSSLWRHLLVEIRICRIRRGSKQKIFFAFVGAV